MAALEKGREALDPQQLGEAWAGYNPEDVTKFTTEDYPRHGVVAARELSDSGFLGAVAYVRTSGQLFEIPYKDSEGNEKIATYSVITCGRWKTKDAPSQVDWKSGGGQVVMNDAQRLDPRMRGFGGRGRKWELPDDAVIVGESDPNLHFPTPPLS